MNLAPRSLERNPGVETSCQHGEQNGDLHSRCGGGGAARPITARWPARRIKRRAAPRRAAPRRAARGSRPGVEDDLDDALLARLEARYASTPSDSGSRWVIMLAKGQRRARTTGSSFSIIARAGQRPKLRGGGRGPARRGLGRKRRPQGAARPPRKHSASTATPRGVALLHQQQGKRSTAAAGAGGGAEQQRTQQPVPVRRAARARRGTCEAMRLGARRAAPACGRAARPAPWACSRKPGTPARRGRAAPPPAPSPQPRRSAPRARAPPRGTTNSRRRQERVRLSFRVPYRCHYGQDLAVVGSDGAAVGGAGAGRGAGPGRTRKGPRRRRAGTGSGQSARARRTPQQQRLLVGHILRHLGRGCARGEEQTVGKRARWGQGRARARAKAV